MRTANYLKFNLHIFIQFSYSLHPITTSNAPSETYYRSCWHVFSL